jgi:hypothetical protein
VIQPDGSPSPAQAERLTMAAFNLAAAENADLASANSAALVVLVERLRRSLDDMIRLHHERDAA